MNYEDTTAKKKPSLVAILALVVGVLSSLLSVLQSRPTKSVTIGDQDDKTQQPSDTRLDASERLYEPVRNKDLELRRFCQKKLPKGTDS